MFLQTGDGISKVQLVRFGIDDATSKMERSAFTLAECAHHEPSGLTAKEAWMRRRNGSWLADLASVQTGSGAFCPPPKAKTAAHVQEEKLSQTTVDGPLTKGCVGSQRVVGLKMRRLPAPAVCEASALQNLGKKEGWHLDVLVFSSVVPSLSRAAAVLSIGSHILFTSLQRNKAYRAQMSTRCGRNCREKGRD